MTHGSDTCTEARKEDVGQETRKQTAIYSYGSERAMFARRRPLLPSFLSLVTDTKVLRYFNVVLLSWIILSHVSVTSNDRPVFIVK